jgi:hypothetical protein
MSVDLSLSNASLFELITKHKHCFVCRGVILPGEEDHIHCYGCNEKLSKETMTRDIWHDEAYCAVCYKKYKSELNEVIGRSEK